MSGNEDELTAIERFIRDNDDVSFSEEQQEANEEAEDDTEETSSTSVGTIADEVEGDSSPGPEPEPEPDPQPDPEPEPAIPDTEPGGIPTGANTGNPSPTPEPEPEPEPDPQPESDSQQSTPSDSPDDPSGSGTQDPPSQPSSAPDSADSGSQSQSGEDLTAIEEFARDNEDISLDNDIDPGGRDDLDDPGSVVQLDSGRVVSEDRFRTLEEGVDQIQDENPDTDVDDPSDITVGTNDEGDRVFTSSTQLEQEQFADAVEDQEAVDEDITANDVIQGQDGDPQLDSGTEDAVQIDQQRAQAAEQLDEETDINVSEDDVVVGEDGAELDLDAQRRRATQRIDADTQTDVAAEDLEFTGDSFDLSDEARREEGAIELDSGTETDITASDVSLGESGEVSLREQARREEAAAGIDEQTDTNITAVDVQETPTAGVDTDPGGFDAGFDFVAGAAPLEQDSQFALTEDARRQEVRVRAAEEFDEQIDARVRPSDVVVEEGEDGLQAELDFIEDDLETAPTQADRPDFPGEDISAGSTPGSDASLQGQTTVAATASQVSVSDEDSLGNLSDQAADLTEPAANQLRTEVINPTARIAGAAVEGDITSQEDILQALTQDSDETVVNVDEELETDTVIGTTTESTLQGVGEVGPLVVNSPATVTGAVDTGSDAIGFTADAIEEQGVVEGSGKAAGAGVDVAATTAQQTAETAANRPAFTAGTLVGTAGTIGAASRLGSTVGRGTAAAIQPGEELLTGALSRTGVASRLPGGRADVEEVALATAQGASNRLQRLNINVRGSVFDDTRAMGGGQRQITIERETETESGDTDAVEDLPPREAFESEEAFVAARERRRARQELEQETPPEASPRDMFQSNEAFETALEKRAARTRLEQRLDADLDEVFLEQSQLNTEIERVRERLFEDQSRIETETAVEAEQEASSAADTPSDAETVGDSVFDAEAERERVAPSEMPNDDGETVEEGVFEQPTTQQELVAPSEMAEPPLEESAGTVADSQTDAVTEQPQDTAFGVSEEFDVDVDESVEPVADTEFASDFDSVFETGFETGLEQSIEVGQERSVETGVEQSVETGVEQSVETGVEQSVETSVETGLETGLETSLGVETSQELESELPNEPNSNEDDDRDNEDELFGVRAVEVTFEPAEVDPDDLL